MFAVDGAWLAHSGQGGPAAPWTGEGAGDPLIRAHVFGVGFETVSFERFGVGPSRGALLEAGLA